MRHAAEARGIEARELRAKGKPILSTDVPAPRLSKPYVAKTPKTPADFRRRDAAAARRGQRRAIAA